MASRKSIGTADFREIARQIVTGELEVGDGCRIEVSSAIWQPASNEERAAFLAACDTTGIEYEFVQQIGGASIVCD